MKEIEFRAKVAGIDSWIYGFPHKVYEQNKIDSIQESNGDIDYIAVDTIGQYTGLKDESGEKIFKNDIFKLDGDEYNYLVVFKDGAFGFHGEITGDFFPFAEGALDIIDGVIQGLTIVGNIHENPELLNQEV